MERAKFEMKGEKYDPKLKPRKLRKKELETLKKKHDKMFAWVPDKLRGQRSKKEKVSWHHNFTTECPLAKRILGISYLTQCWTLIRLGHKQPVKKFKIALH